MESLARRNIYFIFFFFTLRPTLSIKWFAGVCQLIATPSSGVLRFGGNAVLVLASMAAFLARS